MLSGGRVWSRKGKHGLWAGWAGSMLTFSEVCPVLILLGVDRVDQDPELPQRQAPREHCRCSPGEVKAGATIRTHAVANRPSKQKTLCEESSKTFLPITKLNPAPCLRRSCTSCIMVPVRRRTDAHPTGKRMEMTGIRQRMHNPHHLKLSQVTTQLPLRFGNTDFENTFLNIRPSCAREKPRSDFWAPHTGQRRGWRLESPAAAARSRCPASSPRDPPYLKGEGGWGVAQFHLFSLPLKKENGTLS